MTTLHFSDGVSFEVDGDLKIVRKSDGLYVTGQGFLIPVDSVTEAQKVIKELQPTKSS